MQLREFTFISPSIETGQVFKAIESAMLTTVIDQEPIPLTQKYELESAILLKQNKKKTKWQVGLRDWVILSGSCLKTYTTSIPRKKRAWYASRGISQRFEYSVIRINYWVPSVRHTTRRTMGIKKCCPSVTEAVVRRWNIEKLKELILAVVEEKGIIDWKYGAVDGSFSPA